MANANGGKTLPQTLDEMAKKDQAAALAEDRKAKTVNDVPVGMVRVRLIRPMTDGAGRTWDIGIADIPKGMVPQSATVLQEGPNAEDAEVDQLALDV